MSFQEEKRELIKRYLLEKIRSDDEEFIHKTMENFSISITTIKRYLRECLEQRILLEDSQKKSKYSLVSSIYDFTYTSDKSWSEDHIYFEDIFPLLNAISPAAISIWGYSFMEIMNNALEHSHYHTIQCRLKKDYLYTEISITDDGIGIFKNIQHYLQEYSSEKITYMDALTELYKGKFTTNKETHSGEGIFFTSKVLNEFVILSDNTMFSQGSYNREHLVQSHLLSYYNRLNNIGTMVIMKLENQTTKKIGEVFDMYAPIDEGFIKTRIPIREVCQYGQPIARSQARRIVYRLEEFKQIELDFEGVEFMGQGFSDEIFRVFQNKHPDIELIPINACAAVLRMVKHVQKN